MKPVSVKMVVGNVPDFYYAYTPVLETRDGKEGFFLGLAEENEPGYHQLAPGYGPYPSYADAYNHAKELNAKLGLTAEDAARIVCSSMRCR
jgi:hypothetical protein